MTAGGPVGPGELIKYRKVMVLEKPYFSPLCSLAR